MSFDSFLVCCGLNFRSWTRRRTFFLYPLSRGHSVLYSFLGFKTYSCLFAWPLLLFWSWFHFEPP